MRFRLRDYQDADAIDGAGMIVWLVAAAIVAYYALALLYALDHSNLNCLCGF